MQSTGSGTASSLPLREDGRRLARLVEHAAHLLPSQGPITAFVHHNTLHAFEDLPFEQAVLRGADVFGCNPYLPEEHYRRDYARGRISREDLEAVLTDDLSDRVDELPESLGSRFRLRMAMLEHPLRSGPVEELRWVVEETDALRQFRGEASADSRGRTVNDTRHWVMRDLRNGGPASSATGGDIHETTRRLLSIFPNRDLENWPETTWEEFTLHLLWRICGDGVRDVEVPRISHAPRRHRDGLLELTGEDSDQLVHDVLIPFCAAFLDQGFADWSLPHRDEGFYRSFVELHRQSAGPPRRWMRGLKEELDRLCAERTGASDSIEQSLELLGVDGEEEREQFIARTLLALRGFAGMIWQTETRGDRVVRPTPAGTLVEFLAVRLILDRYALADVARRALGFPGPLRQLREEVRRRGIPRGVQEEAALAESRAFQVFQLAQVLEWSPECLHRLSSSDWGRLVHEVESFHPTERRRVYHLAYERQYRRKTLDAVVAHKKRVDDDERRPVDQTEATSGEKSGPPADGNGDGVGRRVDPCPPRPAFQIVCCIDEREESFRRHLEEIVPDCETFGAAGFYGVAMYYRGAADAHYSPLCPVIIKPTHYVREDVAYTFETEERRRRKRRRTVGTVTHRVHVGSRTFAGGWFTAVFGSLASIPLVTRILFPRATAQCRRLLGGYVRTPAVTQLQLERVEADPGPENGHVGYNVAEMATIVERLLNDMGLTRRFSRLIVICGHGSSSLNNPHEAAHDCGACGGGRGGPNARAFARMANDSRVRAILAENGLRVPSDTYFVGCYHNTCDDSIAYYDLDRLPTTHKDDFSRAARQLDSARQRSAHERCRRFESAELRLSPRAALRHVEGRAEDLSQVRPEYGHATNALCFVGRRQWSRGLFLDRRAFLQSYDPARDDEERSILTRILQAVIPVCAGINLEYYFSFVDPTGYGCGTKLPHNITSLVGVMNGASSDLQPGLPWQMVEIHEPVRLLFVIETTPEAMLRIMRHDEGIDRLVRGAWVQLATLHPDTGEIQCFRRGRFEPYLPSSTELPEVASSIDWYRGWRDHLGYASVTMPRPAWLRPALSGAEPTRRTRQKA